MEVQYSYENNIITLDGPAGSGKSTIARLVAERLGYEFLDTGALYRGVTYFLFTRSIEPSETGRIAEALKECVVSFEKIRSPEIDRFVSAYSALPVVRNFLLETQRRAAAGRMIVAEGRDMGSVVFPEAPFKFYLDARPYVRAARRWKELEARGEKLTLEEVERQLQRRDNLDSGRALSPLRVPEKAHIIDTSEKTIHEVVDEIMAIMAGRKDP
jgi:cytidylate kinase